jgi:hypothetical protein
MTKSTIVPEIFQYIRYLLISKFTTNCSNLALLNSPIKLLACQNEVAETIAPARTAVETVAPLKLLSVKRRCILMMWP